MSSPRSSTVARPVPGSIVPTRPCRLANQWPPRPSGRSATRQSSAGTCPDRSWLAAVVRSGSPSASSVATTSTRRSVVATTARSSSSRYDARPQSSSHAAVPSPSGRSGRSLATSDRIESGSITRSTGDFPPHSPTSRPCPSNARPAHCPRPYHAVSTRGRLPQRPGPPGAGPVTGLARGGRDRARHRRAADVPGRDERAGAGRQRQPAVGDDEDESGQATAAPRRGCRRRVSSGAASRAPGPRTAGRAPPGTPRARARATAPPGRAARPCAGTSSAPHRARGRNSGGIRLVAASRAILVLRANSSRACSTRSRANVRRGLAVQVSLKRRLAAASWSGERSPSRRISASAAARGRRRGR